MFKLTASLLLLVFLVLPINAATYYVDNSEGNDNYSGTSTSSAWRSLSRVNSNSFNPGDIILLKRGGEWREQLNVSSSGTASNYITIGAYSSGENPLILGSNTYNWTQVNTRVWKATGVNSQPYWVWFKHSGKINWGRIEYSKNVNNLDSLYNFYWDSSYKTLYVYATSNPSTFYSGVEVPQREWGVNGGLKEYLKIENLTIRFVNKASVLVKGKGAIVQKNILEYSGTYDTEDWGDGVWNESSYSLIKDNYIKEHAGHGINNMAYFRHVTNVIIEGNTVLNNYHNNIDYRARYGYQLSNVITRYNTIYMTKDCKRDGVAGIFMQGNYAEKSQANTHKIYYNIIYDMTGSGIHAGVGSTTLEIYNNTVYGTRTDVGDGWTACYYFFNDAGTAIMKNNIGMNGASWIVRANNFSGKTLDYNMYYQEGSGYFAKLDNTNYSPSQFSSYVQARGQDKNSIYINPQLADPVNKNFALKSTSPAINKGTSLGLSTDYMGFAISGSPDLGACEYGGAVIQTDNTPPVLQSVSVLSSTSLKIIFSEPIKDAEALTTVNYGVTNGVTISSASISSNKTEVILTTSAHATGSYTVTASNIKDLAGNTISSSGNSKTYEFTAETIPGNSNIIQFAAENGSLANGAALKIKAGSIGAKVAYCSSTSSTIKFTVNVPSTGTWYAWGRLHYESTSTQNSFNIQVDNGTKYALGNDDYKFNQWHWDGYAGKTRSLGTVSAGTHTITISGREPKETVMIDQIILTNQADYNPNSTADITAPVLQSVSLVSGTSLKLIFSEPVKDAEAITAANYKISNGVTVLSAVLASNKTEVTLTTSAHAAGSYAVTVSNVKDLAGNTISSTGNSKTYEYASAQVTKYVYAAETAKLSGWASLGNKTGSLGKRVIFFTKSGNNATASYTFNVPTSGVWYVWSRLYYDGDGSQNSFYIKVDKGSNSILGDGSKVKQWHWDGYKGKPVSLGVLNAGSHKLIISGKEPGYNALIDLVVITNDPNFIPDDNTILLKESAGETLESKPENFNLSQNYPNPFNPSTTIRFSVVENSYVSLKIYDILGKEVAVLVDGIVPDGNHQVMFDAQGLSSGIYIYQLRTNELTKTLKMQLLK